MSDSVWPPSLGFSRQEHWSGLPFPSPMHKSEKWKWSHSVMSDSFRPHGLQPTRLLHPCDFPGRSSGVGCHCLLRVILTGLSNFQGRRKRVSVSWQSNWDFLMLGLGMSCLWRDWRKEDRWELHGKFWRQRREESPEENLYSWSVQGNIFPAKQTVWVVLLP